MKIKNFFEENLFVKAKETEEIKNELQSSYLIPKEIQDLVKCGNSHYLFLDTNKELFKDIIIQEEIIKLDREDELPIESLAFQPDEIYSMKKHGISYPQFKNINKKNLENVEQFVTSMEEKSKLEIFKNLENYIFSFINQE